MALLSTCRGRSLGLVTLAFILCPRVCCWPLYPHMSPTGGVAVLSSDLCFCRAICLSVGGLYVCSGGAAEGSVGGSVVWKGRAPPEVGQPSGGSRPWGPQQMTHGPRPSKNSEHYGSIMHSDTPSVRRGLGGRKGSCGPGTALSARQMMLGLGSLGRVSLGRWGPR